MNIPVHAQKIPIKVPNLRLHRFDIEIESQTHTLFTIVGYLFIGFSILQTICHCGFIVKIGREVRRSSWKIVHVYTLLFVDSEIE